MNSGVGRCFGCDQLYNDKGETMSKMPNFDSLEEAKKFLRDAKRGKSQSKAEHPSSAKSRRKKNPVRVQDEVAPLDTVYCVISFYVRKGDSWTEILRDARSERESRNVNVIVNAHNHFVGEDCHPSCHEL